MRSTIISTQKDDIAIRLNQLQEAEDNYYVTAKYVLELVNRAYDLFMRSEAQERRQLITLVLQNVKLKDKKLVWDVQKPFDVLLKNNHRKRWRG